MNLIDKSVAFFSPQLALKRVAARERLRKFEAASRGERLNHWGMSSAIPSQMDLKTLRARSRFLYDNNPYARRGSTSMAAYLVGKGIIPHAAIENGVKSEKHEKILKLWADTTACDNEGMSTLYGLQNLVVKHLCRDGEIFVQKVFDKKAQIPLKLKLLESEYLDEQKRGDNIISGIEYNKAGQRVAYWLYPEHPETSIKPLVSKRIPATDILHIFVKERASQARGVPWLAPIIVRLKDFDDYEDAELTRQKMAACFVGFFRDLEPMGDDFSQKNTPHELKPGSVFSAPPGQTLEFSNPPSSDGFKDFAEHQKLTLAVGLGVPYMLISGDYSKANYSSSRMCMLNFYRHVEQLAHHVLIPQFCDPIFSWFIESCQLIGVKGSPKALWTPPKKDLIDPQKDMEAFALAVEKGFLSHPEVVRELGDDPDDVYEEIAATAKLFQQKGIFQHENTSDSSEKREARFLPQTLNLDDKTVEVTWSTGARVLRAALLEDPYYEELSMHPDHVDLKRLNSGAPVLNSHRSDDLSQQIGVVERAWIEGMEGRALIRMSSRPEVEPIFRDIAAGIIRNLSVGYRIHEASEQKRDGDDYKTLLATRWEPYELSFVPVGADALAKVRQEPITHPLKLEEETMQQNTNLEKERIREILSLTRKFDLEDEFTDKLIVDEVSIENARAMVLDRLSERSEKTLVKTSPIEMVRDEKDTQREGMTKALMHRADPSQQLDDNSKRFRSLSLVDMAKTCIGDRHVFNKEEIVRRAFHSTSDFPLILGNVAKQKLLQSYSSLISQQTFWPFVRVRSASDFRPFRSVRIGEMPSLDRLPEGAEYTYGTLGEEAFEWKIGTFGKAMSLTRQMVINDDLGAFDTLGQWGAAISRLEAKLVWSILVNNEKLPNGKNLFHKDHKNLADKGAPLSIESLSQARLTMARHKGLDEREGEYLNIQAKYLIIPPELQTQAEQFLSREVVPQKPDEVNPFKGAFTPIVTPWMTDPKAWILAASLDQGIDLIEMAYLDGVREPYIEWHSNFDTDSMKVKVRMDVGAKAIDYRGFYKGA